jgi:hypothetical protein
MKTLFTFEKEKVELVDKPEVTKDEEGKEITIIRKEEVKTPVKFAIIKPNRAMQNDAETFYNVEFANNLKAGMVTRAMIVKRLADDGGIFSVEEMNKFEELRKELVPIREEFQALFVKKPGERTEEEQKRFTELADSNFKILSELRKYEAAQESMYAHTAEANAFNKFVSWWVLTLGYAVNGTDFKPICPGKDYKEKMKNHDVLMESNDKIFIQALTEISYLVTYWVRGLASSEEDFEQILADVRKHLYDNAA